jgi:hypothetical protein
MNHINHFYSEFYSHILSDGVAIIQEILFSLGGLSCQEEKEIAMFALCVPSKRLIYGHGKYSDNTVIIKDYREGNNT